MILGPSRCLTSAYVQSESLSECTGVNYGNGKKLSNSQVWQGTWCDMAVLGCAWLLFGFFPCPYSVPCVSLEQAQPAHSVCFIRDTAELQLVMSPKMDLNLIISLNYLWKPTTNGSGIARRLHFMVTSTPPCHTVIQDLQSL